ncbi:hypothetical protein BBO_07158 [Beauveria brongniartii RCEF 3172]|uniref:Uncharacterized protein n=1 Tax=Beauveria brongniartii RCEF 3172 TaxID=1081107 RepID=A0A167A3P4_9HYPO|nr:hypothetical protein BBO_07158 [Beauveria brongniartii RCEF 3172]
MKASSAVVAVTASASAQTLTGPFSFVDESISAGPLSVPNAATPVFTQSSNMTSTSASTWVASPARRILEWTTILRKDASTSDLEPAAAAAATNQMMTTILTTILIGDVSVVRTVKKHGEPDLEEKLRSIFGDRRGGPSGSSTSTSSVHPEEHSTTDPAATLRIQEHLDVLRTMTKETRTTQGEKSCVTPNPAGTIRGQEILDILRTASLRTASLRTASLRTESMEGSMTTNAVATPTWDVESRPTVEHVEDVNSERVCG